MPAGLPSWSMARPSSRRCARRSCRRGAPSSSSAGTSTAAPNWWARSRRLTDCPPTSPASSPNWWLGGPSCRSICCCGTTRCSTRTSASRCRVSTLNWQMPEQVTFCLDSTVPFGSSQHQKLVVVDDALAFSGGLDLTIRRWDTSRHDPDNARRVDPAGEPYRPFHDVQMMVDGDAARALALLARSRWCHANGGEPEVAPEGDPWPKSCEPRFHGCRGRNLAHPAALSSRRRSARGRGVVRREHRARRAHDLHREPVHDLAVWSPPRWRAGCASGRRWRS